MPNQSISSKRATMIFPIILLVFGGCLMLQSYAILPKRGDLWSIALALIGVLTFVVGRFNKSTIVIGPFFLIASLLSVLRQHADLAFEREVPLIFMTIGVLMLIARSDAIPDSPWMDPKEGRAPPRT